MIYKSSIIPTINLSRTCDLHSLFRISTVILTFLTIMLPHIGSAMSRKLPYNKFFFKGKTSFISTFTAQPTGSVCKIRNTGTTLDGVNIYFEPNSITKPLEVKVFLNNGYLKLEDGTVYNNPIIQILFKKNIKLHSPVKIAVPVNHKKTSRSISCFYIREDGSLKTAISTPSEVFEDKVSRFSLYTYHPGLFTWIKKPLAKQSN